LKAELSKSATQMGKEESQKDKRISEMQTEISKLKSTATNDQKALAEMEEAVERVTQESIHILLYTHIVNIFFFPFQIS
jgi:septal ring factor EnvC (AmiA/AmiB activator)